jgi:molybdate/tungstate transport system substrate-binding protein
MRNTVTLLIIALLLITGCKSGKEKNIIIFHAGSLTVPVKKISEAFEKANPGVRVLSEAAGSLQSARKITELQKPCDIMLSADYSIIDDMLIPAYASWNISFASNEIVIAYRPESAYSAIFREDNWPDILLKNDVIIGRADPDADPCGYRTVFAARLAEEYYGRQGLADSLLNKNIDYIRPKEVDLVALTETGVIDYMFQYKSVAIQHGFEYLELPDEINLSSPDMKEHYGSVSYMIPGDTPGSRTEIRGESICYSGTIPDGAPHKELAVKYFSFLLSGEGIKIFRESGQEPLNPVVTGNTAALPPALQSYINATSVQ